ncbi:MAG: hemerythrin domain-containing protein [Rhodospirillaceae bacterium]|nr:hemerythrin domain-containing protein [Rhodospirillaceae bacterium]
MQTVLSDTLGRLSQDHVSFRRLLNVLGRQIDAIAQYRAPDFDVLNGVLAYFSAYPGRFHHPVEHLIYEALKERIPAVADAIAFIEEQHRTIARELDDFAAAVKSVRADVEVSRRAFCEAGRKFIAFEREHIRGEEASLFYLAVSKLTSADWLAIDIEARRLLAPLSEEHVGQHFHKLYADVAAWDFENHQDTAPRPN